MRRFSWKKSKTSVFYVKKIRIGNEWKNTIFIIMSHYNECSSDLTGLWFCSIGFWLFVHIEVDP